MTLALARPFTVEQFLAWEQRQELRHEFDGIRTIAMTGGTGAHMFIQAGLLLALGTRLRGKPCRPGGEFKIRMAESVRYPDAVVVCTPVPPAATFITDPVVIFEILSKSTGGDDLGKKRLEYQNIPSLQRYIVLAQSHRTAHVFYRNEDKWEVELYQGEAAILKMPEIAIELPLAEVYEDIVLESELAAG